MKTRTPLLRAITLLCLFICFINAANAYDFYVNGIYYKKSGKNAIVTYRTTSYNSYSGNITIPEKVTYGGVTYYVIGIGDHAFDGCVGLKRISLPQCGGYGYIDVDGNSIVPVKSIGNYAFRGCTGLDSLELPIQLETIGNYAFASCSGLVHVEYPYSLKTIGDHAFENCVGLSMIRIGWVGSINQPYYDITIGQYAFYGCTGLTEVSFGDNVKSINNYAFYSCSKLNRLYLQSYGFNHLLNISFGNEYSNPLYYAHHLYYNGYEVIIGYDSTKEIIMPLIIPDDITTIGPATFAGCTGITSVTIPEGVTSIGKNAFLFCDGISSLTWNAIDCSSIGSMPTFNFKDGDVTIGDKVKTLPNYFLGSSQITNIDIPYTVTTIGSYAFAECYGLTEVVIPNRVSTIGDGAFAACINLEKALVLSSMPPGGNPGFGNSTYYSTEVYVPTLSNYQNNSIWKNYKLKGIYDIEPTLTMLKVTANEFPMTTAYIYQDDENMLSYTANNNTIIAKDLLPNTETYFRTTLTYNNRPYSVGFSIRTQPVTFSSLQCSSTQTTLNISFNVNRDEGFVLDACGFEGYPSVTGSIKETTADSYTIGTKITGLSPNCSYYYSPWVQYKGQKYYGYGSTFYTNSIGVNSSGSVGPTSVDYTASYSAGDAHVTNAYFTFQGTSSKNLRETGLEPRSSYGYKYTVETSSGNQSNNYSFTTPALSLVTQVPRMLKNTMPMFIAETNIADIETSCGFEWRRYDAPEEMPSTKVYCPVYGGVMAGTLKNLSENVYYKYRPFYKSSAGNEYYGDWIAFITADAGVEFEPVVYTYDAPAVTQTDATLQGVALRGSEEITSQGFEYWQASKNNTLTASNNMTRVTAKGERMSKTVSDLQPGTKYRFRAFVTAGGETTYGKEVEFVTLSSSLDVNLDGEVNIADVNSVIDLIMVSGGVNTGDVNGDGEINIADINTLIDAILSK